MITDSTCPLDHDMLEKGEGSDLLKRILTQKLQMQSPKQETNLCKLEHMLYNQNWAEAGPREENITRCNSHFANCGADIPSELNSFLRKPVVTPKNDAMRC